MAFFAASLSLLATPGPTNTLLATSGAAVGVRRSLPLLAAELCGYMAAIAILRVIFGPVVAALPAFGTVLRIAVVLYLLHLSVQLWRRGAADVGRAGPVDLQRVFVATLLNPKGIIFAYTLLPQGAGMAALTPWLAGLALQIMVVGCVWISAGASLRRGFRGLVSPTTGYRLSAVALTLLAGVVSAHAFK